MDSNGNRATWSAQCTRDEYGDPNDTMAADNTASGFDAVERNRLGWMSGRILDMPAGGGGFVLSPLELTTPGYQVLRLTDGPPIWLEYRLPVGVDTEHLATPGVVAYVPYNDHATAMLDLRPNTTGFADASLQAGQQWITPGGNYTITLARADSIGAVLTITLNRVTVPDVKGVDQTTAIGRLHAAGLTLGLVHNVVDMNCDNLNIVTGQNPAAGSTVLPGTAVSIDVTVAPKPPTTAVSADFRGRGFEVWRGP